jgi:DNA modification methylase
MTVQLGDGIEGIRQLPPESVDLVLCDLPSGETAAEFDKPVSLPDLWGAINPALAPFGCVVLMASSLRFAAAVIDSRPEWYRYDLIWSKSIATGFLNAKKRPLRSHEFILVFAPSAQHTYHPQLTDGHLPISSNRMTPRGSENYGKITGSLSRRGATDRFPRSVLEIGSLGVRDKRRVHPQQKPTELMDVLVRTYSNPGDVVCDPCAGSGSTGDAAIANGRKFLGWDKNPRFGERPGEQLKLHG